MLDTSEITLVNSTDVFVLVCFAKLSGKFYQSTYNIQLHRLHRKVLVTNQRKLMGRANI